MAWIHEAWRTVGGESATVHARFHAREGIAPFLQLRCRARDIRVRRGPRRHIARRRIGVESPLQVRTPSIVEPGIGEVEGAELLAQLRHVLVEYAAQCCDALRLRSPAAASGPQRDDHDHGTDQRQEDEHRPHRAG